MFEIIIHAFQMDINCINEILLMFKIIIHVFQKDFMCILIKNLNFKIIINFKMIYMH